MAPCFRNSKWGSGPAAMAVDIIVSEGCLSVGDALRDVDSKSLLNDDFVLVNGDIVSNVNLEPLIQLHKYVHMSNFQDIFCLNRGVFRYMLLIFVLNDSALSKICVLRCLGLAD